MRIIYICTNLDKNLQNMPNAYLKKHKNSDKYNSPSSIPIDIFNNFILWFQALYKRAVPYGTFFRY